jgi:Uma2 family endonuclease
MHMATRPKRWTLAELHRLPDDGNKYELVRGDLLVTPPPSEEHETIIARLTRILDPYVAVHELGLVYHARAVVRYDGSEVEPDLMVRQPPTGAVRRDWENAPTPVLVVEVISGSTRRRDFGEKRGFYGEARVPEYWIIDAEHRSVLVVRPNVPDVVVTDRLGWRPNGVADTLDIDLPALFDG